MINILQKAYSNLFSLKNIFGSIKVHSTVSKWQQLGSGSGNVSVRNTRQAITQKYMDQDIECQCITMTS